MPKYSSNKESIFPLIIDGCPSFSDVIIEDMSLNDENNDDHDDSFIKQENP